MEVEDWAVVRSVVGSAAATAEVVRATAMAAASSVFIHTAQKAVPSTCGCACVGDGVTRLLCGPPGHMPAGQGHREEPGHCALGQPPRNVHTPAGLDSRSTPTSTSSTSDCTAKSHAHTCQSGHKTRFRHVPPHTERASNHDDVKRVTRHGSRALHFPRWREIRASTFSGWYGRTLSLFRPLPHGEASRTWRPAAVRPMNIIPEPSTHAYRYDGAAWGVGVGGRSHACARSVLLSTR